MSFNLCNVITQDDETIWLLVQKCFGSLLVIVCTIKILIWLHENNEIKTKQELYKKWIKERAIDARDKKQHNVLLQNEHSNGKNTDWISATEIYKRTINGELDPIETIIRASYRCRIVGRDICNAITEEFYDDAVLRMKEIKTNDKQSIIESMPLYGVPISVKECLGMKGTYSTGGLACRLRQRDDKDCVVVKLIKQAGAIPVCSGNVTQIMFLPESVNNIWGRSSNPWNLHRTPGGSSGGEAALVAAGCIPLAIGSDVAGSIRIPASFCGVVGFKPTTDRVSVEGSMIPRKDNRSGTWMAIPVAVGPIARTVDDCIRFMKSVLVPDMWKYDQNIPPIPFRDEIVSSQDKLRIGYFDTDGWFEPCETSKRAIQETVKHLQNLGHTVSKFDLPTDGWFNYGLLAAINGADGNMRNYIEALEGEEMIDEYLFLLKASKLPNWLRYIISKSNLLDKRRLHLFKQVQCNGISAYDLLQLGADLKIMRNKWSNAMKNNYDAIIFPAMPIPALPHGMSTQLTSTCSYMFLANMLKWPSGTVPVTTILPEEAHYNFDHLPFDQRDYISKLIADHVCTKDSTGLPISISVMTTSYKDELCLRIMKEIEMSVQFTAKPEAYKRNMNKESIY